MKRPNWYFALQNRVIASKQKRDVSASRNDIFYVCAMNWNGIRRIAGGAPDVYRTPITRSNKKRRS